MAVYEMNENGDLVCVVPDKTLAELHTEVQQENALQGLDQSPCVQDTLKQINGE